MDEDMIILLAAFKAEFARIEQTERVQRNQALREHVSGMRQAVETDGLKGLIIYLATNPAREDILGQANEVTLEILEKIKPTGADLAKLLNESNIEVVGTAGFYISELLGKGALDTSELRKSAEFNTALGKMKENADRDIRRLANLLDKKVGIMESNDATTRKVRTLIRGHLLRADGPGDRKMRRTIRSQLRRVVPVDTNQQTKPRGKLPGNK